MLPVFLCNSSSSFSTGKGSSLTLNRSPLFLRPMIYTPQALSWSTGCSLGNRLPCLQGPHIRTARSPGNILYKIRAYIGKFRRVYICSFLFYLSFFTLSSFGLPIANKVRAEPSGAVFGLPRSAMYKKPFLKSQYIPRLIVSVSVKHHRAANLRLNGAIFEGSYSCLSSSR